MGAPLFVPVMNGEKLVCLHSGVILGLVPRTHHSTNSSGVCLNFKVAANFKVQTRGEMGPRDKPEDDISRKANGRQTLSRGWNLDRGGSFVGERLERGWILDGDVS